MPKEITKTVYLFSELSEKAQQRAIDNARNVEAECWGDFGADFTLEDAISVLRLLGFTVKDDAISYSGFSSQGDGASFVGSWYPEDVKADQAHEHAPKDETILSACGYLGALAARLIEAGGDDRGVLIARHYGAHYSHEHSVRFDFGEDFPEDDYETFTKQARDLMRWIYGNLEAEYYYQTSDDTIRERLIEDEDQHVYRENGEIDW